MSFITLLEIMNISSWVNYCTFNVSVGHRTLTVSLKIGSD